MNVFPSIAPLFWLKGEDKEVIIDGLEQLKKVGINNMPTNFIF